MDAQLASATPDYAARGLSPDRVKAIETFADEDVLDVGCGSGAYVLHFAGRMHIRGVDHQRFESWARRPDLFDESDAQQLALPDSSVGTIVSFETLEHLPDPRRALREYLRVCRRNLILTVPNCTITPGMRMSGIIYNHWIDRTHRNFWDLDTIATLVRETGFEVVHTQLINPINLGHAVAEALRLRGFAARACARVFRMLQAPNYFMTCLVVAHRPGARGSNG